MQIGLTLTAQRKPPADRIANGGFATDTVWTKGANWTIGSGKGTKGAGAENAISQAVTVVAGTRYILRYTISDYTAGNFTPSFQGGTPVTGTTRSANGDYVEFITAASGNTTFQILGDLLGVCSVDNVSIR